MQTSEIVIPDFGDIVTFIDVLGVERRGIMEYLAEPDEDNIFACFVVTDDTEDEATHRWGYLTQITQINGINTFPQDR